MYDTIFNLDREKLPIDLLKRQIDIKPMLNVPKSIPEMPIAN